MRHNYWYFELMIFIDNGHVCYYAFWIHIKWESYDNIRRTYYSQQNILTIAKLKKLRKGPRTNDKGCTQASVSESNRDEEDAIIPTASDEDIPPILFTTSIISIGNACKLLCVVEDTNVLTADDEW